MDPEKPTMMPDTMILGMMIYLTDVKHRGGSLVFAAGSHVKNRAVMQRGYRGIFEDGIVDDFIRSAAFPFDLDFPYRYEEFIGRAGDVMIFHHLLSHIGTINVSDQQTRHALSYRLGSSARIRGTISRSEATTIERVNSATFLSSYFPGYFELPKLIPCQPIEIALRNGFGESPVVTQVVVRFRSLFNLFHVSEMAPSSVQIWKSTTLSEWTKDLTLCPSEENIRSLGIWQSNDGMILDILHGEEDRTAVSQFVSNDLKHWSHCVTQSGNFSAVASLCCSTFESTTAVGSLFLQASESPTEIKWVRMSSKWLYSDEARPYSLPQAMEGQLIRLNSKFRIVDLCTDVILDQKEFGLICDLQSSNGGPSGIYYSRSTDGALYSHPLQLLPVEALGSPRGIRVVDRTRGFWFVTYISRGETGEERTYVGYIDWLEATPTLRQIDTLELLLSSAKIKEYFIV